jgi:glycosyltransferase involved in cell wall biosynthesis
LNIVLISTLYAPNMIGGAERVAQAVAEGLAARGNRVSVISLSPDAESRRAELNGVQVHYCRLKNLYWPFPVSAAGYGTKVMWHLIDTYNTAMARSVGEKLDEIRPDVVNTHNLAGFSVAAWGAVKARQLPLVHTLHDQYLLCPYSTMFKNGKNCGTRCLGCRLCSAPRGHMTNRVDGVIGVSRFILQRHLDLGFFAAARAAVVHSGYPPPAGAAPAAQTRLPLRIGFLGRLELGKGLHRLIEAFLGLPRGAAELRVAGTGDSAYEASLRQRVGERGDVRWLGFVAPETFLPELDVLVVPSLWHEAMGRVVLEAFAHGIPVIGSDRGGIPELIDKDCGWIFDPDKPEELRGILQRCVDQPQRLVEMRKAASAALLRFSSDAMLAGYLDAYRDAIRRSPQRQAPAAPA